MALSALEGVEIRNELRTVFSEAAPNVRSVMVAAGVAGQGAKSTDVQAEVATVLTALFGQTAPVIGP